MTVTVLRRIGRLFTATERGTLTDVAVWLDGGRIAAVTEDGAPPPQSLAGRDVDEIDCGGALVTPGLVDAHTHPLYAGDRHAELAARSTGASYADLASSGGIGATVRATRAATPDALGDAVAARLRSWLAHGTTTVEVKTGYDLTRDGELAGVRLLSGLRARDDLPDLSVTFLAAHALPPEAADLQAHAEQAASWAPAAREAGADSVDVFCDEGYFTVDQSRTVLRAGAAAGLVPRIHADELAHTGGAMLAAEIGAASADHLLHVDAADARAMAAAGVVAVLCPGTALAMGRRPDVAALRDAGVTLALGSDHNPGMSGVTDMSLVVALGVSALGLSVDEALHAATAGAATALRLPDRGVVAPGARADLVAWDAAHEGAFAWAWGLPPRSVYEAGRAVA